MSPRKFILLSAFALLVATSALVANESSDAKHRPVPGAIALSFDAPVTINTQTNPIKPGDSPFSIVSVGRGEFRLDEKLHLTATIHAAVSQYAEIDYWIHAAILDERGRILAVDSHQEPVGYVRVTVIPTLLKDIELDFGISEDFKSAKYVVVTIAPRKVPHP